MAEKKKEGKKSWSKGKKIAVAIIGTVMSAYVLTASTAIVYGKGMLTGIQESHVQQIKSVGDLNNDGVDDLVTYDGKGQKVVYICRENDADACISQDWYLANVKTEMDGKTQKKADDLKKLIEENLKKFEQRK